MESDENALSERSRKEFRLKYADLIRALDPGELYTPGTIAMFADRNRYVEDLVKGVRRTALLRIRVAMGRFSNNHSFPDIGDGFVIIPGQAPTPGWFGWRWQEALETKSQRTQSM